MDKSQAQMMVSKELQHEIFNLNVLLGKERASCITEKNWMVQLVQELEQTKEQLAKQKTLKEMYINREKETRRELERLQKYTDKETLSTSKITTQVRNNIKQKKKKLLQKDYEELQVAHLISQEKLMVELQGEQEKNKALQEELENLRASNQEVTHRYEADVLIVRQQADNLQRELEMEIKVHADRVSDNLLLEKNLRAEQDALRQKMAEDIKLIQQNAAEQEQFLRREVEELKAQLNTQLSLNHELSTELKAERENMKPLQEIKVAHLISQETFTAELQREQEKNKALQEELENLRASNQEVTHRYEADILTVRQQADNLQCELEKEILLKTERENMKPLQEIITSHHSEANQEENPNAPSDPEHKPTEIKVCEEILPTKTRKSVWKRTRHFLGLRKPQRWKTPKEPTSYSDI